MVAEQTRIVAECRSALGCEDVESRQGTPHFEVGSAWDSDSGFDSSGSSATDPGLDYRTEYFVTEYGEIRGGRIPFWGQGYGHEDVSSSELSDIPRLQQLDLLRKWTRKITAVGA